MSDALPIYDVASVDLAHHAVIEASAGTGKTWTLERLVARLVREGLARLDEVLIVTFTEKAAGELQQRLRDHLHEEAASDARLSRAVETFDLAAIHTIHGFCQRMLRQYAFENGAAFEHELANDDAVYRTVLHDLMRRDWPARYGADLPDLLAIADYPDASSGASKWEEEVVSLALKYRPRCGDCLRPAPAAVPPLGPKRELLHRELAALAALVGPLHPSHLPASAFVTAYAELKQDNVRSAQARREHLLLPLLELLHHHQQAGARLTDFVRFLETCREYGAFEKDPTFTLLHAKVKLVSAAQEPLLHNVQEIARRLDLLVAELALDDLAPALKVDTLTRLQAAVAEHKLARGLFSYDDLLTHLDAALAPGRGAAAEVFLHALRRRFRYALVDEFQDTDPVQWSIFRRLFTGSPDHRLIIIGDPKQAIYSFRGADLGTYLEASRELLERHDGRRYTLPTNYRAVPELIDACNELFAHPQWFAAAGGLTFAPVAAPPPEQRQNGIAYDATGRDPVSAIDLGAPANAAAALREWAAFIAREIRHLLGDGQPRLHLATKAGPRPLQADDICILTRTGREARACEQVLADAGLPVTYYKKPGLYQSEQTLHLIAVLQAIAQPADREAVRKALLSRFFALSPAQLHGHDTLPAGHPARQLLDQWVQAAAQRDWPRLCQSLLDDSAVLLREIALPDGERRVANYRHLLQELLLAASRDQLTPQDLVQHLRLRRQRSLDLDQDEDLHRLETELPKVRLMTMHTSKGLEFPVVFIAGGFAKKKQQGITASHHEGARTWDLAGDPAHAARATVERDAEDRRLYYVALTRAAHKLYLPRVEMKAAGPLTGFIQAALSDSPWRTAPQPPAAAPGAPVPPPPAPLPPAWPDPLLLPPFADAHPRRLLLHSFTSLHQADQPESAASRLAEAPTHFAASDVPRHAEEALPTPSLPVEPGPLPPGAATGELCHDLLEHVDYAEVMAAASPAALLDRAPETARQIDEALLRYGLASGIGNERLAVRRLATATLLYHALRTPLAGHDLRLGTLSPGDRLHEQEFFFPAPLRAGETLPGGLHLHHGYVHGFIDLLFHWQGRVYLLDWKSNLLADGYGAEALARCMRTAEYELQARLYRIAVARWLPPDGPPFGGTYYLFLRGLTGQPDSPGIYFLAP